MPLPAGSEKKNWCWRVSSERLTSKATPMLAQAVGGGLRIALAVNAVWSNTPGADAGERCTSSVPARPGQRKWNMEWREGRSGTMEMEGVVGRAARAGLSARRPAAGRPCTAGGRRSAVRNSCWMRPTSSFGSAAGAGRQSGRCGVAGLQSRSRPARRRPSPRRSGCWRAGLRLPSVRGSRCARPMRAQRDVICAWARVGEAASMSALWMTTRSAKLHHAARWPAGRRRHWAVAAAQQSVMLAYGRLALADADGFDDHDVKARRLTEQQRLAGVVRHPAQRAAAGAGGSDVGRSSSRAAPCASCPEDGAARRGCSTVNRQHRQLAAALDQLEPQRLDETGCPRPAPGSPM